MAAAPAEASAPGLTWALWQAACSGERGKADFAPVTMIFQNPELPNGCEVTSLAMLLASAGCPIDKLTLYETYLPRGDVFTEDGMTFFGPDPEEAYAGDARTEDGWYCYEEPILTAANAWLRESGSALRAQKLSGIGRDALDTYAQAGIPLLVWVTTDWAEPLVGWFGWSLPDWEAYYPYTNLHCVLLTGEEGARYRIADPLAGVTFVDRDVFWASFDAMGRRAVCLARQEDAA